MNPASRSFTASAFIVSLHSSPNFLFFWETYPASLYIESLWTTILGSTPGKSIVDQTNKFVLSLKVASIKAWLLRHKSGPSLRLLPGQMVIGWVSSTGSMRES